MRDQKQRDTKKFTQARGELLGCWYSSIAWSKCWLHECVSGCKNMCTSMCKLYFDLKKKEYFPKTYQKEDIISTQMVWFENMCSQLLHWNGLLSKKVTGPVLLQYFLKEFWKCISPSHIFSWHLKYFMISLNSWREQDFPGGAAVRNLPANAGDVGSSPGPARSHMLRSN